ncbi:MAG: DNA-binding protein [Bacilli bacterium]|nr:DNA-binding protein [Bacilli bacterium]
MYRCFRLTKGLDLKKEIESYTINNKISGVVLCAVGCLSKLTIRLADGKSILEKEGMFEIVSIMGTLSEDGVHIHISVSDEYGNTIGGHLKDGCIVNTTAEIVLNLFENIKLKREFDKNTGYAELIIN